MRSKVRAYSHQGQGPRDDQQDGYISATSDSTTSLANGSRSIHLGQSFAFVARPISGGSERRDRPFGENDSAAHGSRLRARFLVFHTDRWDVSQRDHTGNTRVVT